MIAVISPERHWKIISDLRYDIYECDQLDLARIFIGMDCQSQPPVWSRKFLDRDLEWFEQNPDRTLRLRMAGKGEFADRTVFGLSDLVPNYYLCITRNKTIGRVHRGVSYVIAAIGYQLSQPFLDSRNENQAAELCSDFVKLNGKLPGVFEEFHKKCEEFAFSELFRDPSSLQKYGITLTRYGISDMQELRPHNWDTTR